MGQNGHRETLQKLNAGEEKEKREPSSTGAGNGNWEQLLWKTSLIAQFVTDPPAMWASWV